MKDLTARQAECLSVIEQSIRERGYPPTYREIGNAMGIRSTTGVNDHLRALERKGFVAFPEKAAASRAVMPTRNAADVSYQLLEDLVVVCAGHGFDGDPEGLAAWLEKRLARSPVA